MGYLKNRIRNKRKVIRYTLFEKQDQEEEEERGYSLYVI
jgi:hypothetical protein